MPQTGDVKSYVKIFTGCCTECASHGDMSVESPSACGGVVDADPLRGPQRYVRVQTRAAPLPAAPVPPSPTRLRGCLCVKCSSCIGAVLTAMPALCCIQMTPLILQYSLYSKDFFRFFFCRLCMCMYHL